jgi:predicted esterase
MIRTVLLSILLVSAVTPLAATANPASCGAGSWIAGTTELCDGVLVYRDYVYDDYGSRLGDPGAESIGPTAGKVRYTEDINSADLIALRLEVDGDELHVSFEMNTLYSPDSTFAALAIDTDNNTTTGGGDWADLLAVEQPHGSGSGLPLQSDGWEQVHVFEEGDPKTNIIEGTIPLPQGTTWRVQAVTGIKSRRVVMNVAFREDNETSIVSPVIRLAPGDGWAVENGSNYFESQQALVLTTTDISRWGAVVEVEKMIQGVTEQATPATGFHQRVFESAYTIFEDPATLELHFDRDTEGVSYEGVGKVATGAFAAKYNFLGKYQPYGIYIPENTTGPHGVFLALHGANQSHSSLVGGPGMQQNIGETYNNIIVTPLARGPMGWYQSIAEREVLEVIADIEANYTVNNNRRYAAGYSMGGYAAFRIASLYPHMFAGFISWNGATTSALTSRGITHRIVDFLKNTRQVPGAMLYAAADELVWIDQYLALQAKYRELQYESILYLHPAADHFTFGSLDDWQKEAAWIANRTLQKQPKQVIYRTYPVLWRPKVGVIHDRAYWVSNIVGHNTGPEQYVDIDLITYGCGGESPMTKRLPEIAGTDPVPWVAEEYGVIDGMPISLQNKQNSIEGNVSNLESVTIDVNAYTGACLDDSTIVYKITTDGKTMIQFSDGRSLDLPGAGTWMGLVEPLFNQVPEATDDSVDTDLDNAVTINVLDNDTDVDGDLLSVTAITDAKHGSVSLNSNHTVTYSPVVGFVGIDSFTYDISDNRGGTDSASVLVYVFGGGTEGKGRVHGSGDLDRGTADKYDKIDLPLNP